MNKATYPCDLHTHTKRSDGNDTCRELIDNAAEAGVKILVLSDHDIIPPVTIDVDGKEENLLSYAESKGVKLLPSIEFSCDTIVEDVHIVALGCDLTHPFFEEEYQKSIRSKIDGYRALCELLTEDGYPIDWQSDILLDGARTEDSVQRKMIFEAMAGKGYTKEWSDAKLLIKNTPKYSVKREKPFPTDIVQKIHEAGGIAILAHPFLISNEAEWNGEPVSREDYIEHLIDAGLDGLEASYPYDKTSYDGTLSPEEIEALVREKYEDRLSVISGGSDYHSEGKKGSKNPRHLGERGVTMEYFIENPILSKLL